MDERLQMLVLDYRAGRYTRRQLIAKAMKVGATAATLSALLEMAGVAPSALPTVAPVRAASASRTVVVSNASPVTNPDPPVTASTGYGDIIVINQNLFETLVRYKAGTTQLEPALARSWDISNDGLTYTFHLRPAVFHDGTPVNADAVKFNFERQLDEKNPYHYPGMANTELALGNVAKIDAVDEHTIVIQQKRPTVVLLSDLALQQEGVASPAAFQKYGRDFSLHPTGSGPFTFVRWTKGVEFVMDAFDKYWGGRPQVDRVIWKAAADDTVRLEDLRSGAIDVTTQVDFKDVPELRKDRRFRVITGPFLESQYLILNGNKEPFGKKEVRDALQYAVNKQNIAKAAFYGNYTVGSGPIPIGLLGYSKSLGSTYRYDPPRARTLLKDGGVADGFAFTLLHRTDGAWPTVAQLLQADLQAVGLKASLQALDQAAFYAKINASEHQAAINSWVMDTGDPDDIMVPLFSSARAVQRMGYKNAAATELITGAQTERNPDKRRDMYVKAQQVVLETAPYVCLGYPGHAMGAKASVEGLVLSPLNSVVMRTVRVS